MKYCTQEREPFYQIALDYYQSGSPILDIGAGVGGFADLIGNKDIYLIEGNPQTATFLKKKYANVFNLSLPKSFPFEDNFFNLIHCSHLIEHLQPHELYHLFKELDRCLHPQGHIVISTPLLWEDFYDDLSHIKPYSPRVLYNYFCSSTEEGGAQRTRSGVASGYKIVNLTYRYRIVPIPYFSISYQRRWAQRLLYNISNALRAIKFGTYERTGYTIVMKKDKSENPVGADNPQKTLTGD